MRILDILSRWAGLSEPAHPPSQSPSPPPPAAQPVAGEPLNQRGGHNPYADLWGALERQLSAFMTQSVIAHLHFEPDDVFKLERIQIIGKTPQAKQLIARFLDEFRMDSRRKSVRKALERSCPRGVSADHFVDLHSDFTPQELEESDPYAAALADTPQMDYEITLYGEWMLQVAAPVSPAAPAQSSPGSAPEVLEIALSDANGGRNISIEAFPFVVGREAGMAGTFLSRRHGVFERDADGRAWYRDISVNGSMLDGVTIASGDRRELFNNSVLVLGGDPTNAADCPQVVVKSGASTQALTPTPVRAPAHPVTPLRPTGGPAASTPMLSPAPTPAALGTLCMLAVQDAHGSRTLAVTRLPYVIGRDEAADCRIPEENAGVSRQHLVIVSIDAMGAQLTNAGAGAQRWGTDVGGVEQGPRFLLPWNAQAVLAPRYQRAATVKLQLLAPA